MMKKVIISMLIAVCTCGCLMAQSTRDVVYLKNGGVVKGMIIEQIPNQSLKIETGDGSVFVYLMSEIEKIAKEQVTTTNNNRSGNYSNSTVGYRNPTTAWAYSFLIPGGGQFYNGETGKGVAMLGIYAGSVGCFILGLDVYPLSYVGLVGMLATAIWTQVDAPTSANRINRQNGLALALGDGITLGMNPTLMSTADLGMGNSLASGLNITLSF